MKISRSVTAIDANDDFRQVFPVSAMRKPTGFFEQQR